MNFNNLNVENCEPKYICVEIPRSLKAQVVMQKVSQNNGTLEKG